MQCFRDVATPRHGTCAEHRGKHLRIDCPDSCSNLGTCVSGFCSCPPGYFGMDCGLSINRDGQPFAWKGALLTETIDTSTAADMPGFFVYDLQPSWIGDLYQTKCARFPPQRRSGAR